VLAFASSALAQGNCIEGTSTFTPNGLEKPVYQQCRYDEKLNANFDLIDSWRVEALEVSPLAALTTISVSIDVPSNGDKLVPFPWIAPSVAWLQEVRCRCYGVCTTVPTITLRTDNGSGTLIATNTPIDCATGAPSPIFLTNAEVTPGHTIRFSIENNPSANCDFLVVSVVAQ
jgi:hypothetical protein